MILRHAQPVMRPFVLKCPNCVAPVEDGLSVCPFCNVKLKWEPVIPIDKDDFHFNPPTVIHKNDEDGEYLSFPMKAIGGGQTEILQIQPQMHFHPRKLIVPDQYANNFTIDRLMFGASMQFVSKEPILATMFSLSGINPTMKLDTIYVGQLVQLEITNISSQASTFAAYLLGKRV